MNATVKKILMAGGLGGIAWLFIMFVLYTGIMLIVWVVGGLAPIGLYSLWEKYAKLELMKKEENFEILRPVNKKGHPE
jgi:hypothetical protein